MSKMMTAKGKAEEVKMEEKEEENWRRTSTSSDAVT